MRQIPTRQLAKEYVTAANVNVRIGIYQLYSTHPQSWQRWLFDRIRLSPGARILEVGCGPGTLWLENRDRLPACWRMTLSDFSPGMVRTVRENLRELARPFTFEVSRLEAIPFRAGHFDAVIANHVLFHAADIARSLAEIRRVLRGGGTFYASTLGRSHLRELSRLIRPHAELPATPAFLLETGPDLLAPSFEPVTLERFDNALEVTESGPLVDYARSYDWLEKSRFDAFRRAVEQEVDSQVKRRGSMRITVDVGLLKAVRPP